MNENNLGKFESIEQLQKAYSNLHAAFTKKCQEYSILKNQFEKQQNEPCQQEQIKTASDNLLPPDKDNGSQPETVLDNKIDDKPQISQQDKTELEIDKFFEKHPQAKGFSLEIGQALNTSVPNYVDLLAAYNTVLLGQIKKPQDILKEKDFLENYVYQDEDIRQYFIHDYLEKLSSVNMPKIISGQAGVISVLPPLRPKSLKDAQNLAKELLLKKGEF